mmetsp:Transcript_95390/g.172124  ORF Transcript_95390/g.172124 Transcript_95390/m.172124 type:complete len:395 (-) Transcript_95390:1216-2400(-)
MHCVLVNHFRVVILGIIRLSDLRKPSIWPVDPVITRRHKQGVALACHVGQRATGDNVVERALDGPDAREDLRIHESYLAVVQAEDVQQGQEFLVRLDATPYGSRDDFHGVLVFVTLDRSAKTAPGVHVDVLQILQGFQCTVCPGFFGGVSEAHPKSVHALAIANHHKGTEVVDAADFHHATHACDVQHMLAHLLQLEIWIHTLLLLDVDLATLVPEGIGWLLPLPFVASVSVVLPLDRTCGAVEIELLAIKFVHCGTVLEPLGVSSRVLSLPSPQACLVGVHEPLQLVIFEVRIGWQGRQLFIHLPCRHAMEQLVRVNCLEVQEVCLAPGCTAEHQLRDLGVICIELDGSRPPTPTTETLPVGVDDKISNLTLGEKLLQLRNVHSQPISQADAL